MNSTHNPIPTVSVAETESPDSPQLSEATDPPRVAEDSALEELHLLRPDAVDRFCAQDARGGLVVGLLPGRGISILVGDSGLGKSPLAYQLGLCVSAGIPFLGMKTEQGSVVYADWENGLKGSRDMREQLVRFLGLSKAPEDFLLWVPDFADSFPIERICRDVKPSLVIVDSLRSHNPHFEKSDYTGEEMKGLHATAYKNGVSVLLVHHIRKPGPEGVPLLDNEAVPVIQWLNQASGHRSLVNQSHTRIGADRPDGRRNLDAALILRWQERGKDETGPLYVERVYDEHGEPFGYRLIIGPQLLGNPEQEAAFKQLPQKFTFRDAKAAYRKSDNPTKRWLDKCEATGQARRVSRGLYEKLPRPASPPETT